MNDKNVYLVAATVYGGLIGIGYAFISKLYHDAFPAENTEAA